MTAASALLRFSRDRRGYEHFYLIEPTTNRRGKTRARVLYWFRTPPGVKVGRPPFDDEMQRAIEERNPGVGFDWTRIIATPIPPPAPDVERWRDRRRAERTDRAARKAEEATETAADGDEPGATERPALEADALPAMEAAPFDAVEADDQPGAESPLVGVVAAAPSGDAAAPSSDAAAQGLPHKRRRRRRRGGRGRGPGGASAGTSAPVSRESLASPSREDGPQHLDEPQAE